MLKIRINTYTFLFIYIFAAMCGLKNISFCLIVFLLAMLLFTKSIIFLHYSYISPLTALKNCKNITQPKLNCNGKCYIAKQIKATDNEKENNFQPSFHEPDYYIGNSSATFFSIILHNTTTIFKLKRILQGYLSATIKPPAT